MHRQIKCWKLSDLPTQEPEWGDGHKPKRGTNSIELVYLEDPGVIEKHSLKS